MHSLSCPATWRETCAGASLETEHLHLTEGAADENVAREALEAASPFGWERYVGTAEAVVGMRGFGASAPAPDLYKHFGITAEAVAALAKARL